MRHCPLVNSPKDVATYDALKPEMSLLRLEWILLRLISQISSDVISSTLLTLTWLKTYRCDSGCCKG